MAVGGNRNVPSQDGSNRNTDPSKNGPFTQSEIDLLKYSFGSDKQSVKPADEVVNKGNLSRLQSKLESISFEKNQKFFHNEPSKFTKTEMLKFTATYLGMNLSESNDVETLLASEEFEAFFFYKTLAAESHNQNPNLKISDYNFGPEVRNLIKEYLFRITAPYTETKHDANEGSYISRRLGQFGRYVKPVILYLLNDPSIELDNPAVMKAPLVLNFLLDVDPLQLLRTDWGRKPSNLPEYIVESYASRKTVQQAKEETANFIAAEANSVPSSDDEGILFDDTY